jgi:hypothetical protein
MDQCDVRFKHPEQEASRVSAAETVKPSIRRSLSACFDGH